MNAAEKPRACEKDLTKNIYITDSPDGQWAYVGPDGAIFISEPEWEEIIEDDSWVSQDGSCWIEFTNSEDDRTSLPMWYIRLMNGNGDITKLFSGVGGP